MRVGREILRWFRAHAFHLPHLDQRKVYHWTGLCLGLAVIFTGSLIASTGTDLAMSMGVPIPHIVFDAFGYSIHGLGLIPFALHMEKLWKCLLEKEPLLERNAHERLSQHSPGRSVVRKKARKR